MAKKMKRLRELVREKSDSAASLEVYSFSELLLTGCTDLFDFCDEFVFVDTVNGPLKIWGTGLSVTAYRADLLTLEGTITKIEFGGEVCL